MNPADSQPTSQLSSQMDVDMPSAEMSKASIQIKVGVAVEIQNNKNEVLIGQRLGSHGAGMYICDCEPLTLPGLFTPC